jgi:hypothetical protein
MLGVVISTKKHKTSKQVREQRDWEAHCRRSVVQRRVHRRPSSFERVVLLSKHDTRVQAKHDGRSRNNAQENIGSSQSCGKSADCVARVSLFQPDFTFLPAQLNRWRYGHHSQTPSLSASCCRRSVHCPFPLFVHVNQPATHKSARMWCTLGLCVGLRDLRVL